MSDQAKHTLAPLWEVRTESETGRHINGGTIERYYVEGPDLYYEDTLRLRRLDQARLIAAAPDLLVALKQARGTIETLVHGIKHRDADAKTNVSWDPDFTSAIDAVIAKATGAAP